MLIKEYVGAYKAINKFGEEKHFMDLCEEHQHLVCKSMSPIFEIFLQTRRNMLVAKSGVNHVGFYCDVVAESPITQKDIRDLDASFKDFMHENDDVIVQCIDKQLYIQVCGVKKLIDFDFIIDKRLLRPKVISTAASGDTFRIYGNSDLNFIKSANTKDHRDIAQDMSLLHFQEDAPGMVFWHPNGVFLYESIKEYLREQFKKHSYQEVHTPMMAKAHFWDKSGHNKQYGELMFKCNTHNEDKQYVVKPMSCPMHAQIFNRYTYSYKDLPVKIAEFGIVHRNEATGASHGLLRARAFTQDDAHLFCSLEQVHTCVISIIKECEEVYAYFGFHTLDIKIALRPEQRIGEESEWDKAEELLKTAVSACGYKNVDILEHEGAFYGPKIEIHLKDNMGRVWQCGTIQVDFGLGKNMNTRYTDITGIKKNPIVIHRAILGSLERFIGILLENTNGYLPKRFAPHHVAIIPVYETHKNNAMALAQYLSKVSIRSLIYDGSGMLGKKVFQARKASIRHVVVIGEKEQQNGLVSVKQYDASESQSLSWQELVNLVNNQV